MEPAGGFVVTSDARYRTGVVTALVAFGLGAGVAAAVPAQADDAPMVHRVTYTVTAEQPTTVGIYYREVHEDGRTYYVASESPF